MYNIQEVSCSSC